MNDVPITLMICHKLIVHAFASSFNSFFPSLYTRVYVFLLEFRVCENQDIIEYAVSLTFWRLHLLFYYARISKGKTPSFFSWKWIVILKTFSTVPDLQKSVLWIISNITFFSHLLYLYSLSLSYSLSLFFYLSNKTEIQRININNFPLLSSHHFQCSFGIQ